MTGAKEDKQSEQCLMQTTSDGTNVSLFSSICWQPFSWFSRLSVCLNCKLYEQLNCSACWKMAVAPAKKKPRKIQACSKTRLAIRPTNNPSPKQYYVFFFMVQEECKITHSNSNSLVSRIIIGQLQ